MDLKYVLKFLAGTNPGVEFPLDVDGQGGELEIVIGRSPDVQLVLDDPRVSRRHARILLRGGELFIEDLRSTNGVYVNAHKTLRTQLREGDRVIIGTNLLKVTRSRGGRPEDHDRTSSRPAREEPKFDPTVTMVGAPSSSSPSSRFFGALDEIPLLDVLQLMSAGKKTGVIKIASPQGPGEIHLKAGQIIYAKLPDNPTVHPRKALFRMLSWEHGDFEFRQPDLVTFEVLLDEGTEGLILEAARQIDELARMAPEMPDKHQRVTCVHPSPPREKLPAEHRGILQTIEALPYITVGTVLDMCPLPDLETYEASRAWFGNTISRSTGSFMTFPRRSGLLLHITSLPSRFGIGDLGPESRKFVDFLVSAGQSLWQILPLNPPAFGNSPYSALSSFAWNPLLISPELLVEDGFLEPKDLEAPPSTKLLDSVDFEAVTPWKKRLLEQAYQRFSVSATDEARERFESFCQAQAHWLEDYATFIAIKDAHGGKEWSAWEAPLLRREASALAQARVQLAHAIEQCKFTQYLFATQWNSLHRYCAERGVELIGDVPIFVAPDSSDVWANPELFQIHEDGVLPVVAGVPPDAFSKTGQRWGNPLYRWDVLKKSGYRWWLDRLAACFSTVEIVRLDHFLGFLRAWAVPASEVTALKGAWQPGPKVEFFEAVRKAFGDLSIIAEDLGILTKEAEALRDGLGLPGMRVLQFGFSDGAGSLHVPHNCVPNSVIYTGTHDNDTVHGWFKENLDPKGKPNKFARYALAYTGSTPKHIHWGFIDAALGSVSHTAVSAVQDVLGLGTEARMNKPGEPKGNWVWRMRPKALTEELAHKLRDLTALYGRLPEPAA